MSKTLTYEVPDELYEAFEFIANRDGRSVDAVALEWLARNAPKPKVKLSEKERQAADKSLLSYAGAESLGYPTGADNETIDSDLAREYGSTYEAEA